MDNADTIFALSSGAPPAAIAVVRISGPKAFAVTQALAGPLPPPRRASLRTLSDQNGLVLDQALVLVFPGPMTATGEDLAELHLHGGKAVVRGIESALLATSEVRRAEAGEFTRRAFANGRIDLNEAEGLADLLSAETEWQRRAAVHMAGGAFSKAVEQWREAILSLSAAVEALLDFSDEDDVSAENNLYITDRCIALHGVITHYLKLPAAEKLREGLRVVIAGPPNSGKSTLLNALVSREAAIVSDIAGTTRDLIDVPVAFGGIAFVLTDTAGLRGVTEDVIEGIGIQRAEAAIEQADILLWLGAEGCSPLHPHMFEIAAKSDDFTSASKSAAAVTLSAKTGFGISDLILHLTDAAQVLLPPPDSFAINARQRALLFDTAQSISQASVAADPLVVAEELRQARLALDALTGRASTEDMLDTLFGRFCIGK